MMRPHALVKVCLGLGTETTCLGLGKHHGLGLKLLLTWLTIIVSVKTNHR